MKWSEVEIKAVNVDLFEHAITINDSIVLNVLEGKHRVIMLAYAIAHATKYPCVHSSFKGLTWAWLKQNLNTSNEWKPLCRGNTARSIFNQNCLNPFSWRPSGSDVPKGHWLDDGQEFLQRLFISEPLTEEEKHESQIPRRPHRLHLPDNIFIRLAPDEPDLIRLFDTIGVADMVRTHDDKEHSLKLSEQHFRPSVSEAWVGNPPPPPHLFFGRQADLCHLRNCLIGEDHATSVTVLRGWPGVGKTTTAAAVANDAEVQNAFPGGVFWVSLGQNPNIIPELATWGRLFECNDILGTLSVKEASTRLAQEFHGREALLIIDDVWEVEHAEAFRIGGSLSQTLITTRLAGVAQSLAVTSDAIYVLPVLDETSSLELLEYLAPDTRMYPGQLRRLVKTLEGLPLALRVAGHLLSMEAGMGWGIDDLLAEIESETTLLKAKAPSDCVDLLSSTTPSVVALLRKSTDHLDPDLREYFALLGPFAPKPATFGLEDMAAVWQLDDARPVVRQLVSRGLLEPSGAGRFQMHSLLVAHANALLTD